MPGLAQYENENFEVHSVTYKHLKTGEFIQIYQNGKTAFNKPYAKYDRSFFREVSMLRSGLGIK